MSEESLVEGELCNGVAESDEESIGMGLLLDEEDEDDEDDEDDEEEVWRGSLRTPFTIAGGYHFPDYYISNVPFRSSPLRQLDAFMHDWSLDRRRADRLIMQNFLITRPFITRLLPLLLHHEGSSSVFHADDHDHMVYSPGTCTTTGSSDVPAVKFHSVEITNCPFFSPPAPVRLDEHDDVCTPDDKNCFLSALAQLPGFLAIDDTDDEVQFRLNATPEILSGLLNVAEIDRFRATRLKITVREITLLSDLEYIKLGAMIQGSEQLTDLVLHLPFQHHEIPREFFDHVANSVRLRKVSLSYLAPDDRVERRRGLMFAEDGNGMVERLLRNPQCQLIKLALSGMDLDDDNLIALAQLLPTSHIRTLDLRFNNKFRARGLLDFARQFPNMLSLNSIKLQQGSFVWKDSLDEEIEECGAFFLQGLMGNPSITWFDIYDYFPQRPLMLHYLSLNRAGRKLLSSSQLQPIPDGLWPLVLERAGASGDGHGPHFFHYSIGCIDYVHHGPVNAIFFFLQNCPKLLSYCM